MKYIIFFSLKLPVVHSYFRIYTEQPFHGQDSFRSAFLFDFAILFKILNANPPYSDKKFSNIFQVVTAMDCTSLARFWLN